jgi:CheY-like chemotaxis protein
MMPGGKLLIVEDEGILAMNLRTILSDLGYQVLGISTTGERAVELAYELLPDLVIMDIKLAGDIDGIEAARRIKNNIGSHIIFLSAHTDDATYYYRRSSSCPLTGTDLKKHSACAFSPVSVFQKAEIHFVLRVLP